jgi:hypothetical protein
MKRFGLVIAFMSLVFAGNVMAMSGMDHSSGEKDGKFMHTAMVDDVHAEFQVMDLASMKVEDPDGNTHHVMATFKKDETQITQAVGKIKLISPSGKEQVADMKDYGSGVFAANFKIDEPGKWGVICLFKEEGGQHTVKFWYPNMEK